MLSSIVTGAEFECPSCGTKIIVEVKDNILKKPERCVCGRRGKFIFIKYRKKSLLE